MSIQRTGTVAAIAIGRIMDEKNSASPGRRRIPTIATDTAAATMTKPLTIGPSKMRVTGVVMINKTRKSGAGNMLTALMVFRSGPEDVRTSLPAQTSPAIPRPRDGHRRFSLYLFGLELTMYPRN